MIIFFFKNFFIKIFTRRSVPPGPKLPKGQVTSTHPPRHLSGRFLGGVGPRSPTPRPTHSEEAHPPRAFYPRRGVKRHPFGCLFTKKAAAIRPFCIKIPSQKVFLCKKTHTHVSFYQVTHCHLQPYRRLRPNPNGFVINSRGRGPLVTGG